MRRWETKLGMIGLLFMVIGGISGIVSAMVVAGVVSSAISDESFFAYLPIAKIIYYIGFGCLIMAGCLQLYRFMQNKKSD